MEPKGAVTLKLKPYSIHSLSKQLPWAKQCSDSRDVTVNKTDVDFALIGNYSGIHQCWRTGNVHLWVHRHKHVYAQVANWNT